MDPNCLNVNVYVFCHLSCLILNTCIGKIIKVTSYQKIYVQG